MNPTTAGKAMTMDLAPQLAIVSVPDLRWQAWTRPLRWFSSLEQLDVVAPSFAQAVPCHPRDLRPRVFGCPVAGAAVGA
jgi:hypothetical protein